MLATETRIGRPNMMENRMPEQYRGQTVVVTGASAGLGVGFARAFAQRGADLVLVARREDRLNELADELRDRAGVEVHTVGLDLARPESGQEMLSWLHDRSIEPDVLINNAGFGTHGRMVNENRERVREQITLNVLTLTDLTIGVLPQMVERGSGTIVNVASTAAFQPVPGLGVYSATKAYVRSFTEALWGELHGTGVRAFALCPGPTETEFFDAAGSPPSGKLVPASRVVNTLMREIDRAKPRPSVIDGRTNAAVANLSRFIPSRSAIKLAGSIFLDRE
jgi:short-subunit dehydrogenase